MCFVYYILNTAGMGSGTKDMKMAIALQNVRGMGWGQCYGDGDRNCVVGCGWLLSSVYVFGTVICILDICYVDISGLENSARSLLFMTFIDTGSHITPRFCRTCVLTLTASETTANERFSPTFSTRWFDIHFSQKVSIHCQVCHWSVQDLWINCICSSIWFEFLWNKYVTRTINMAVMSFFRHKLCLHCQTAAENTVSERALNVTCCVWQISNSIQPEVDAILDVQDLFAKYPFGFYHLQRRHKIHLVRVCLFSWFMCIIL